MITTSFQHKYPIFCQFCCVFVEIISQVNLFRYATKLFLHAEDQKLTSTNHIALLPVEHWDEKEFHEGGIPGKLTSGEDEFDRLV